MGGGGPGHSLCAQMVLEVQDLLRHPHIKVVCLTGGCGVGKSSSLQRLADDIRKHLPVVTQVENATEFMQASFFPVEKIGEHLQSLQTTWLRRDILNRLKALHDAESLHEATKQPVIVLSDRSPVDGKSLSYQRGYMERDYSGSTRISRTVAHAQNTRKA
eukprot:COSAG02_NODE_2902_length_7777_cov_3.802292_14_plen_160_part_00